MSWWWNRDNDETELRTRVARLERELTELERRHPRSTANIIPFPSDDPEQLRPVADGTAMELETSDHIMRKTNGNGGRTP